jgi:HK97 family phage prohead protease
MPAMRKVFQLNLKSLEQDDRTFSGYGSTFGNVDRVGDIVEKGAFAKSLDTHTADGTMPAMLLHHDMHRPIGVWTKMQEDTTGLAVEGKLTQGVRDADEAYALLKDGALHSMSIGYRVVREEYDRKSGINHLHEINLHELSLVTIPANAAAIVGGVKDDDGIPNIRELERVLREAGLSRREAKAFLAEGFRALRSEEPAEPVQEPVSEDMAAKAVEAELRRQSVIADMLKTLGK